MSVNPVSHTDPAIARAQVSPNSSAPSKETAAPATAAQPTASTVVNISDAAKAAMQEAVETSVQTAAEARKGDHQAQKLLVKEQAAAKPAG